jgi:hypothetical protein
MHGYLNQQRRLDASCLIQVLTDLRVFFYQIKHAFLIYISILYTSNAPYAATHMIEEFSALQLYIIYTLM